MITARPCATTFFRANRAFFTVDPHAGGHSFEVAMPLPSLPRNAVDLLDYLATTHPTSWIFRDTACRALQIDEKTARRCCYRLVEWKLVELRPFPHNRHLPQVRITALGNDLVRAFYS